MIDGSARGNTNPGIDALSVKELKSWAPNILEVLEKMGIPFNGNEDSSIAYLCEEAGVSPDEIFLALSAPQDQSEQETINVKKIKVVSGKDKTGNKEPVKELILKAGEVVAFVGPTGSGKSQLLSDVESLASGDSPSGRKIYIDGKMPSEELKMDPTYKPVAQISQSMNYILDLSVGEFLKMHAQSRGMTDLTGIKKKVIRAACSLCGEPFGLRSPIISLSGGQSRALMIADAVLISNTPIILVDEIENAGIDREKAMKFLIGEGKIALIATHDPLLALRASKRVIVKNGAMVKIISESKKELGILKWLEDNDKKYLDLRNKLRSGEYLT